MVFGRPVVVEVGGPWGGGGSVQCMADVFGAGRKEMVMSVWLMVCKWCRPFNDITIDL